MAMYRMVVVALGAAVSLSLQPGVTWAVADQIPLTSERRTATVTRKLTPSASPEGDPVIWQHPISSAIPLSSALILRELEGEPAGPTTPTAVQILDDDDLAVVAGVQFRF